MVIFVILKWYKLLYYKKILSIYWMTLVELAWFMHFFIRKNDTVFCKRPVLIHLRAREWFMVISSADFLEH